MKQEINPVLEINITAEEKVSKIKIDDFYFDMINLENYELQEILKISATAKQISTLMNKDNISKEEKIKLKSLLGDITKIIIPDISDKLLFKLKDIQKLAIMNVFTKAAKGLLTFLQQMNT